MKFSIHTAKLLLALFTLCASVLWLCASVTQSNFTSLMSSYAIAFVAYIYIIYPRKESIDLSIKHLLWVAIILRIALIFVFPQLSDDIYRFIWDGNLIHAGINPYASLPTEIVQLDIQGNDHSLFQLLNSPHYYTVYPPIAQLIYYVGTFVPENWEMSNVFMKVINNSCDIFSLYLILSLLKKLKLPQKRVLIYAFNPLVLIELCGNLHMEAVMICTFLLFLHLIIERKEKYAIGALGFSISAKLMPVLFIPLIWNYLHQSKRFLFLLFIFLLVMFSPILFGIEWLNFAKSIDLYFGKFEFNGGVYTLLRFLGDQITGHNLIRYIGPGMALITLSFLFRLWKKQVAGNMSQLIHACFFVICCHYFLSTTVHPWYLSFPLALSLFTRYRFVVLWTGLIMLSYINYSYDTYQENLFLMFIEYVGVLGYLIYEIKKGD